MPNWTPADEAFLVLRERDLHRVLSEGLVLGGGYQAIMRDRVGAQAFAEEIFGRDWAVLRIDASRLAVGVDPNAPMRRGEWITLPAGIGEHTFLVTDIPAACLSDVTADLPEPGLPTP